MTPTQAKSAPAVALSEVLPRQSPGCSWLLRRDLSFEAVYGDAPRVWGRPPQHSFLELFAPAARASWAARVERVFAGEMVSAAVRFAASAREYSVTLFPVSLPGGSISLAAGTAHEMERDLVARTLHTLDAERARFFRFLHDHLGQDLSAAGLQLDLLRLSLAESVSPHVQQAADVQATLDQIIAAVRAFHAEWNPEAVERVGLRAGLDMLAGSLRANFQGNIRVWADATATPPPEAAGALYRIAREAATNAVRHSGCTVIEILLKSLRNGPALEVRDNGRGFQPADAAHEGGMGLVIMRYQADRAGIALRIDSAPGKGTLIQAVCGRTDGKAGEG